MIDEKFTVKILSAPYFIATKLEAFKDRGNSDGRSSHDFEDIIYILENRIGIWEEMKSANEPVKEYLRLEFLELFNNPNIFEWIDSHVERASIPATNAILKEMENFILN